MATKNTHQTTQKLEKQIAEKAQLLIELEGKCRLVAIAAEAAQYGLAMPADLDGPVGAYAWLAGEKQRIGQRHTSTMRQQAVATEIRAEMLQPLEIERDLAKADLKALEAERQAIQAELEATQAPELIDDHRAQIKLLETSRQEHQSNVDRLSADNETVALELADLGALELQADERLAQAIESGKPVDDADLLQIGIKRQVLSKRQQLTRQALEKARQAAKANRRAIDQHQSEIGRLKALQQSNAIRSALAGLTSTLIEGGHDRAAVINQMRAFSS
jgi:hypothetical protein